jgi:site-specific recombinase XerD
MEFLIRTIGHEPSIETVDVKKLRMYLEYLQIERNYKAATLSRVIATMKSFFRFCREREYIKNSPAELIRIPKQARKLPIYLVNEELIRLLNAPDKNTDIGIRDYAIIVTFGMTGIRRQELVNANITDVDFSNETLKVFGKGAKERLVPLNKVVLNALRAYLDRRPIIESEALFLNMNNRRLSERPLNEIRRLSAIAVGKIVKKYIRIAGINKLKISPHKLRHTFATLLHMNEVDIIEIQKLLGHASITSTQIYTHTNPEKLKRAVDKLENLE